MTKHDSAAQNATGQPGDVHPMLSDLRADLAAGDRGSIDRFWSRVAACGAPLVEELSGGRRCRVTFLWRAAPGVAAVALQSPMGLAAPDPGQLSRVAGTDVWYRTYDVRSDARLTYAFWPDPPEPPADMSKDDPADPGSYWVRMSEQPQPDPFNPDQIARWHPWPTPDTVGIDSILQLPGARPEPWSLRRPDVPVGAVAGASVSSRLLGAEREVRICLPATYSETAAAYPVVVLLDGELWEREVDAPAVLANLAAAGEAPELVAVLVRNATATSRLTDYGCNEGFTDFLAGELLPWLRSRYNTTADPRLTTLGGASLGGLAAAFGGLRHPAVFGNVLSITGAFWWGPENRTMMNDQVPDDPAGLEWLTHQFAAPGPLLPLRFFLSVGVFEFQRPLLVSQLVGNRHLAAVLRARGYDVTYDEYPGGHQPVWYRAGLADGLRALLKP